MSRLHTQLLDDQHNLASTRPLLSTHSFARSASLSSSSSRWSLRAKFPAPPSRATDATLSWEILLVFHCSGVRDAVSPPSKSERDAARRKFSSLTHLLRLCSCSKKGQVSVDLSAHVFEPRLTLVRDTLGGGLEARRAEEGLSRSRAKPSPDGRKNPRRACRRRPISGAKHLQRRGLTDEVCDFAFRSPLRLGKSDQRNHTHLLELYFDYHSDRYGDPLRKRFEFNV